MIAVFLKQKTGLFASGKSSWKAWLKSKNWLEVRASIAFSGSDPGNSRRKVH